MKAVLLKCLPAARFHFGLTGLDDNSSLYRTSIIPHSDTLFSAIMITCNQVFGSQKTDDLRKAIEQGRISFSSAFYFLENNQTNPYQVFFLPKPESFEASNTNQQQRKFIRKIKFISRGVWSQGILPKDWINHYDENGKLLFESACIIVQDRFVVLQSELRLLFGMTKESPETIALAAKNLQVFSIETEPKIADHTRRREDNIFFQTDVHLATNLINEQQILPHFYFLARCEDQNLKNIFHTVINILADEGIGGGISTGCGALVAEGKATWIDFPLHFSEDQVSDNLSQVNLSLICPQDTQELKNINYYKIITRGGRPIGFNNGRLERVKMIKEGAIVKKTVKGSIPELTVFRNKQVVKTPVPYYRNGKAYCISIPKNYEI